MKRTLFVILLLSFKSYSQDIAGKWDVISYEDEVAYYNKTADSLSYKNPSRKDEAESLKQKVELIFFSMSYTFYSNGKYVVDLPAVGETENGEYKVDKKGKKLVMIDVEGNKDELSYAYEDGILYIRMKMQIGFIKLGLTKVSN